MTDSIHQDVSALQRIIANLQTCILGKDTEIELLVTALLAEGHILLEDVPGTGKTVMIKALARSIQGQFRRIQCNPDLLPTDITGVSIYHPKEEDFIFRPGPVMTNILLADEINRATTKTQSALLEAMEERSVSVDGISHPLPRPFILLATQNPVDFEGTYTLPEAQVDRFLLKMSLGYPDEETEVRMVGAQSKLHPLESLQAVTDMDAVRKLQEQVRNVHIDEAVSHYGVSIVRKTRNHPSVYLGASPRASISLIHAARAYALLKQRDYVIPDDIKFLVPFVLGHRVLLRPEARMDGHSVDSVLANIVQQVRVPIRMER